MLSMLSISMCIKFSILIFLNSITTKIKKDKRNLRRNLRRIMFIWERKTRFKQKGGIKQKGELNVGKFLLSCTRC